MTQQARDALLAMAREWDQLTLGPEWVRAAHDLRAMVSQFKVIQ